MKSEDTTAPSSRSQNSAAAWDERLQTGDLCWYAEDRQSEEIFHASGVRDLEILLRGLDASTFPSCRALEIGCGIGRLLLPASRLFQSVVGVDISPRAIDQAKVRLASQSNIEFCVSHDSRIDLPTASVDLVCSFATFGHMPLTDVVASLREVSRVLRVDGRFQLQVYLGNAVASVVEDTYTIRSYAEGDFREALRLGGYTVAALEELILPYDLVDRERGRRPFIASLLNSGGPIGTAAEMEAVLCPGGELAVGEEFEGSELEYRVVATRINELVRSNDLSGARRLLDFLESTRKVLPADVQAALLALRANGF